MAKARYFAFLILNIKEDFSTGLEVFLRFETKRNKNKFSTKKSAQRTSNIREELGTMSKLPWVSLSHFDLLYLDITNQCVTKNC